jgi:hypothetical protein
MVIKKENSDSGDWKSQTNTFLQVAIFKKTFREFGKILPKQKKKKKNLTLHSCHRQLLSQKKCNM